MAGLANDGGMAEYIIGDADNAVLLPDGLSFEQAAPLMCAGVRNVYIRTYVQSNVLINVYRLLHGQG